MTYELIEDDKNYQIIKRQNLDGTITWIPINESNSDYQRYLRHLAGEDESGTLS